MAHKLHAFFKSFLCVLHKKIKLGPYDLTCNSCMASRRLIWHLADSIESCDFGTTLRLTLPFLLVWSYDVVM